MYRLTSDPTVVERIADNTFIPASEGNRLFAAYRAWLDEGNVPEPYVPPPPPPVTSVTRRQGVRALILAGVYDQVLPAIEAIPDETQRALMRADWETAQTFDRDDPTLQALAAALRTPEGDPVDLDALFTLAAEQRS